MPIFALLPLPSPETFQKTIENSSRRLLGVASEYNSSLHFRLLDDYSREVDGVTGCRSVAINEYMGSGAIDPFQVVYLAFDVSWFLIGYIINNVSWNIG